jgi:hypothetical protein
VQGLILVVAGICIPLMLFPKPFILSNMVGVLPFSVIASVCHGVL